MIAMISGGGEAPPSGSTRCRLWIAKPDRSRQEDDDGVRVARGATWWSHDRLHGFMTNEARSRGRRTGDPVGSSGVHLDPARVLRAIDVRLDRRARRRRSSCARGRGRTAQRFSSVTASSGADDHELHVDRERGVVLRVESRLDGEPFVVSELLDARFDEELPDELFTLELPPGERAFSPRELHAHDLSLEEVAARASFAGLRDPGAARRRVARPRALHEAVPGPPRVRRARLLPHGRARDQSRARRRPSKPSGRRRFPAIAAPSSASSATARGSSSPPRSSARTSCAGLPTRSSACDRDRAPHARPRRARRERDLRAGAAARPRARPEPSTHRVLPAAGGARGGRRAAVGGRRRSTGRRGRRASGSRRWPPPPRGRPRFARASRGDVVHYPLTIRIPSALVPSVVTLHDLQHLDLPHLFSRAERAFRAAAWHPSVRGATWTIVASAFVRDRAVALLGLDPRRVEVIHHGIDHAVFSPPPDGEPREPFLLYPARPWRHKNHARLFEALSLLRRERPELRLVLTGGGDFGRVPEGVEVRGHVPHERTGAADAASVRARLPVALRGVRPAAARGDGLRLPRRVLRRGVAAGGRAATPRGTSTPTTRGRSRTPCSTSSTRPRSGRGAASSGRAASPGTRRSRRTSVSTARSARARRRRRAARRRPRVE